MWAGSVGYLVSCLEAGDGLENLLAKLPGFGASILCLKLICKSLELFNAPSDAPPSTVSASRIALAVYTEGGIILSLNQEISALVSIRSPWLNRARLINVVLVSILFVGLVD